MTRMGKLVCACLALVAFEMGFPQQAAKTVAEEGVMLAAVSRDTSVLAGGIGSGGPGAKGTAVVEPLARVTEAGVWQSLPCDDRHPKGCERFEREYLSKPHTYSVVSGDGTGGVIRSAPAKLSECYGFSGKATYSGADLRKSAIAASATDFFGESPLLQSLAGTEARPIRMALAALVPAKLDSLRYVRIFSVRLEDRNFVVLERVFSDYAGKPEESSLTAVFAIGVMDSGRFHVLQLKKDSDEHEQILGTIHLKVVTTF
jgi:hypothetical protein